MSDQKLITPVALIIFNRPDTTRLVFEEIRKAQPQKLLVIADGAREHKVGEAEKCAMTRAIIDGVDWQCDVLTNYSDKNLGCKQRVSSGIDWVFEQVEEAIILEDDCVPDQTFFRFCQEMLARFKCDERIMMISGTNLAWDSDHNDPYYYSRYPHIWGWATWRRVWDKYDVDMIALPDLLNDEVFIRSFENPNEYKHWAKVFNSVCNGKVDTWDAQVVYLAFMNSMSTVYPSGNFIKNIGFDSNATHTNRWNSWIAELPHIKNETNFDVDVEFKVNKKFEEIRKVKEGIGVNRLYRIARYFLKGIVKI